jgi:hypothetical protein
MQSNQHYIPMFNIHHVMDDSVLFLCSQVCGVTLFNEISDVVFATGHLQHLMDEIRVYLGR